MTWLTEARALFRVALPLMGAQLAQMGMGVTDAIMAGHYDAVHLAGVALGGSIMWPVMLLFMGLVQAVTPTVAQLNGARNYAEIGEVICRPLRILTDDRLGERALGGIEIVVGQFVRLVDHLVRDCPVVIHVARDLMRGGFHFWLLLLRAR